MYCRRNFITPVCPRYSQVRKGSRLNDKADPCCFCPGWCSNCRYLLYSWDDTLPSNLYSGLRRDHRRARRDREGASLCERKGERKRDRRRGWKTGNAIKGGWVRQGRITGLKQEELLREWGNAVKRRHGMRHSPYFRPCSMAKLCEYGRNEIRHESSFRLPSRRWPYG